MQKLFILLGVIFFNFVLNAATCTSTSSGNWSDAATWDCGVVPTGGDSVIILAGHVISVTGNTTVGGSAIMITCSGTLSFDNNSAKLNLPCGSSINLTSSGLITFPSPSASQQLIICNNGIWSGTDGDVSGGASISETGVLPVSFLSASIVKSENQYSIHWTVASELHNEYFLINLSEDGFEWFLLDSVQSIGDHNELVDYHYNFDDRLNWKTKYVQLLQRDLDGTIEILTTMAIDYSWSEQFSIFPNPVQSGEDVRINLDLGNKSELLLVELLSLEGKLVAMFDMGFKTGNVHLVLPTNDLDPGQYVVSVISENARFKELLLVH